MTSLTAIRGDDFSKRFTWRTKATSLVPSVPINLTGYTVEFIVTINGDPVTYTTVPVVTVTPLLGRVDVLVADEVTSTWGTSGKYHLRVTSGSDAPVTLARGVLRVE